MKGELLYRMKDLLPSIKV